MSDYDTNPAAKKAEPSAPLRLVSPASKTPTTRPLKPARRVPTAEDLVHPPGRQSLDGASSAAMGRAAEPYVDAIYRNLGAALGSAISRLKEPPPPPDRSFALKALGIFVESVLGIVTGTLSTGILEALKARNVPASAVDVVKDQLKNLGTAIGGELKQPGPRARKAPEATASGTADLAAKSLLDEFTARSRIALNQQRARAKSQLLLAEDLIRQSHPEEVRPLLETLDQHAGDGALATAFQQEIVIGWLNFCAATTFGPRSDGETLMPNANKVGGSSSPEWRRTRPGFVEISVNVPEDVRGLEGVTLGKVSVGSDGPGAAEMLKRMQLSLDRLPVHRRIWIGRHALDRLPDIVITPEHQLEVNTNSSLLAAIATGAPARLQEIQFEGRSEEIERARLIEKALRAQQAPARTIDEQPGPLGPLVRPLPAGTTPREDERIASLTARRHRRADDAQRGAAQLVAWLHQFTTGQIDG
jgi:hypothetical protein